MRNLDAWRIFLEAHYKPLFTALCFLFIYPIVAADILHRDDIWRIVSGDYGWNGLGRPLASGFSLLASLSGGQLVDTAPLGQLFFSMCLLASMILTTIFFKKEYRNCSCLPLAIVFFNPFMLGNILYQYDSFGMGLAILLVVIGLTMSSSPTSFRFFYSVGLFSAVLALYQPTLNLLVGLTALQVAVHSTILEDLRGAIKVLVYRVTQFCAAYAVYTVVVGRFLTGERAELVEISGNGFALVFDNAMQFTKFAMHFFEGEHYTFKATILVFLVLSVLSITISIGRSRGNLTVATGFLVAFLGAFLSWFGPMLILDEVSATYRTMPTIYVPLAVASVYLTQSRKFWPVALIPLFVTLILTYQTMAAYKSQRYFDNYVAQMIVADLNAAQRLNATVYTFGSVPDAPHTFHLRDQHSIIDQLTAPAKTWVLEGLLIKMGLKNTKALWNASRQAVEVHFAAIPCGDLKIVSATNLYTIVAADMEIFVLMPDVNSSYCFDTKQQPL
ncbi:glucosyltransferase domain-containing protein [uncultured Roseobacter sp.]|uniref:glucosyltransferase domain-containing protein n=1 Tax=uncultured Roseobacter sp. TaxID=114847 RepID=UPI002632CF3B|nr:glucosyltransferase domain-containing protein [uncultured Roseobacter sp.]